MYKTRITVTGIVTLAVAIISFGHILEVAQAHGNALYSALMYPIAIDGMMIGCTLALLVKTGVSKQTRRWATVGRYVGFGATVYANVLHSGWASADDMIVNGIPAVALIILTEVLITSIHGTPATRARRTVNKKK